MATRRVSPQGHLNHYWVTPTAAALWGRDSWGRLLRLSCGRSSWSMFWSAIGIGYSVVCYSLPRRLKRTQFVCAIVLWRVSCWLWRVRSKEIAVGGCMSRRKLNPATLPLHWPKTSLILGSGLCHLRARSQNSEIRTLSFVTSFWQRPSCCVLVNN